MTRKIVALFAASLFAAQVACQAEPPARTAYEDGAPAAAQPSPPGPAADTGAASPRAGDHAAAGSTAAVAVEQQVVLFLGTSLTAGYGVGEDAAFPALVGERIRDAGLPYRIVNAGLSGETSAGGLRRLEWSLQEPVDVFVLELGANDGLRGLSVEQMRANLDAILRTTREAYPDVRIVIAGMEAPPNLGAAYTEEFRAVFRDLAAEYDAALVPFLLDGVAGVPELNQADGIHPNRDGHRIIADHLWSVLEPILSAS